MRPGSSPRRSAACPDVGWDQARLLQRNCTPSPARGRGCTEPAGIASAKANPLKRDARADLPIVLCCFHPSCFSSALFPSELFERSSKRSAPLARSCPILLSFFASSLDAASRKPSAACCPALDDFRSSSIWWLLPDKTPPGNSLVDPRIGRTTFQSDPHGIVPDSVEAPGRAAAMPAWRFQETPSRVSV